MSAADVVVVGAGCAGLSAAGGRTFATRDRVSGDWVDNGQHVLFGCYRDTFAYLARNGAARRVRVQASLTVPMIDQHGRTSELRCPALPSPLQLAAGVLAWNGLPWRERVAVARLGPALAGSAPPPAGETVRAVFEIEALRC